MIAQWTRAVVAAEGRLSAALQSAVDATPWVTKYKAQGDFGLPLTGDGSDDPLVCLCRVECLLALWMTYEAEGAPLPVVFMDEEKMEVLEKQSVISP